MIGHHDAVKDAQTAIIAAKEVKAIVNYLAGRINFHYGRDFRRLRIAGDAGKERRLLRFQHSYHIDAAAAVIVVPASSVLTMIELRHRDIIIKKTLPKA